MSVKLYVIKDMLQDYEPTIYTFGNDLVAKRTLPYIAESNPLYKRCPKDFALYCVGDFDFKSGEIDSHIPEFVCYLEEGDENANMA